MQVQEWIEKPADTNMDGFNSQSLHLLPIWTQGAQRRDFCFWQALQGLYDPLGKQQDRKVIGHYESDSHN
jgi:hypothetical protein